MFPPMWSLLGVQKRWHTAYWAVFYRWLGRIHLTSLVNNKIVHSEAWHWCGLQTNMICIHSAQYIYTQEFINSWYTSFIQSCTYLTPAAPLVAMIDSCQVVLNGTPIHDPSTLVGATNSGLLLQEEVEVNTRMRNWSGTLLRGMVELVEAKSSICNATAYQPVLSVAEYWSVHCNTKWSLLPCWSSYQKRVNF